MFYLIKLPHYSRKDCSFIKTPKIHMSSGTKITSFLVFLCHCRMITKIVKASDWSRALNAGSLKIYPNFYHKQVAHDVHQAKLTLPLAPLPKSYLIIREQSSKHTKILNRWSLSLARANEGTDEGVPRGPCQPKKLPCSQNKN